MNKKLPLMLAIGFLSFTDTALALSGREIMLRNEDARKLQDITSSATLTTGGGGSAEKIKQFTWWRKLQPDGIHYNTLTRFHVPAEVRGEGILFLEHAGGANDVMLYLPNFKKIRRVESHAQSGSFMGSEFSYSDIGTPHVEDYSYKILREEDCCHVVESVPVNDGIRERTGYSRSVTWVRKDIFMSTRGEYFDVESKLYKKMEASETREVDPTRHKWLAHHVRMENVRNGRFTTLQFAKVKVNAGIPDATFTQQNLASGK